MHLQLATKEQVIKLFEIWKVTEPLPKKGTRVIVAFPPDPQFQFRTVSISNSTHKATYGGKLYNILFKE